MKNDSMNCNLFVEATREKFLGPVLNLALLLFAIESYFMQIIDTISTFLIINLCSYTSQMGLPGGTNGKESACQCRERKRPMSNPWSGRFPKVENANGSSILAWKILWTEEPGGLQSTGLQRVGCNWIQRLTPIKHWTTDFFCNNESFYVFYSLLPPNNLLALGSYFIDALSCAFKFCIFMF